MLIIKKKLQFSEKWKINIRIILKEKGGIQDQISATYGGIILIECYKNFKFKVKNIIFSRKNIKFLEDHLILIYSDITRFSSDIHSSQNKKKNIKSYHEVKKEVKDIIDIIKKNSAKRLGIAFNNHWQRKRKLSKKMTSKNIVIVIELNSGCCSDVVYTCDLSYDYVRINAEYTTWKKITTNLKNYSGINITPFFDCMSITF